MDVYQLSEEDVHVYYVKRENTNRINMIICWDITNELIHNLMVYESNLLERCDYRIHSCFWVNIVKEITNWKTGMNIFMNVCSWGNGSMKIEFTCEIFKRYSSIIDEDGYLLVKEYIQDIGYGDFYKFHCVYNEFLDDTEPYVLK